MSDLIKRLSIAAVEEFGVGAKVEILRNPNVPTVFCISVLSSGDEPLSFVNNTTEDDPFLRSVAAIRARLREGTIPPVVSR
jgi:hypothetical protein